MTIAMRALAAALVGLAAGSAFALEGNVNVFAGQKWYSDSDWTPIETQPEFGVLLAFGQLRAPVHFAVDVFQAEDEQTFDDPVTGSTRVSGRTIELAIGVRKVFRREAITHPHLGGGAVLAAGEQERRSSSGTTQFDDSNFGYWVDAGITWRIVSHLNVGLEVRYSRVPLEFGDISFPEKVPAGGFHAGALIGFGW